MSQSLVRSPESRGKSHWLSAAHVVYVLRLSALLPTPAGVHESVHYSE